MSCGWCFSGGVLCATCGGAPLHCRQSRCVVFDESDDQDLIGVCELLKPCFACGPRSERERFAEELRYTHRPPSQLEAEADALSHL